MDGVLNSHLHCLHGFLGSPEQWDFLLNGKLSENFHKKKSYDLSALGLGLDLNARARRLNQLAQTSDSDFPVLMGYSLGGRIALHALLEAPGFWKAAVIVSANPGLKDRSQCEGRVASDLLWAKKFRNATWDQVLREWEGQPVFSGSASLGQAYSVADKGPDYRESNADLLVSCSVGKQRDLRPEISKFCGVPILWVSGEKDLKYSDIAREMSDLNPWIKSVVVAGAGHRVPWENPLQFEKEVFSFFLRIKEGKHEFQSE